jgi:hypothetical protein
MYYPGYIFLNPGTIGEIKLDFRVCTKSFISSSMEKEEEQAETPKTRKYLDFGFIGKKKKPNIQGPPPSLCQNPDGSVCLVIPPEDPEVKKEVEEEEEEEYNQWDSLNSLMIVLPPGADAFDEVLHERI